MSIIYLDILYSCFLLPVFLCYDEPMDRINDVYSFVIGQEEPLSADVAIIEGDKYTYLFEVGNGEKIVKEIEKIEKPKIVILSHFHPDHIANLSKIEYEKLFLGDNTYKYINDGVIIKDRIVINDGVSIELFKIVSCHAKGSIGLKVGDYAFIGDALAPTHKKGKYVFNCQMLKEEIDLFDNLDVNYFVSSHSMDFPLTKAEVITKLRKIYDKRKKDCPYISIN